MDKEEIQKAIAERFDNLQPEIQAVLMDTNYEKNLFEISQKYKLTTEQMGKLELNTTLVLLGEIHPDEYSPELIEDLKLPKEKVGEIVVDIIEKILKNILGILKNNYEREDKEEAQAAVEFEEKWNDVPPVPPYAKPSTSPVAPVVNVASVPNVPPKITPPANLPILPIDKKAVPETDSMKELGVMKNAGIELIETPVSNSSQREENDRMTKKEDTLLGKSGIDLIPEKPMPEEVHFSQNEKTEKSTLYGIEHPQNTPARSAYSPAVVGGEGDLIKEKLKGIATNTATVSNHDLSQNDNPSTTQALNLSNDKYHESI